MSAATLAFEAQARLAAHPAQPTRKEEIEFDRFCRETLAKLAEEVLKEKR